MKYVCATWLIIVLLFSGKAFSLEKIFRCPPATGKFHGKTTTFYPNPYRVEKKMFKDPKVFQRTNGKWETHCDGEKDTLSYSDDSFVCIFDNKDTRIWDLVSKEILTSYDYKNGMKETFVFYNCEVE